MLDVSFLDTVILVNYGFREITYDIDAVVTASSAMKEAIDAVGGCLDLQNIFIHLIIKNIAVGWTISDLITQIIEYQLSPQLLLHARRVQCSLEKDVKKSTEIAVAALDGYDREEVISMHDDIDYACLLCYLIAGKRYLGEVVEQKYIDDAFKLLNKEENSLFVFEILMEAFCIYIKSIENQYEKRELCKKAIVICDRNRLYENWIELSYIYMDQLEKKEQEEYLLKNERLRTFMEAKERTSAARKLYMNHDIEQCKILIQEAAEEFDRIFDGQYNPALGNISFMVRRNEMPECNIPVLELLDKSTWEKDNAFLNINKALVHLSQNDWEKAREEIGKIETDLEEAVEWWSREDVVGKDEKFLVLFLLALEEKLDKDNDEAGTKEFWSFCIENIAMPENVRAKAGAIMPKYISALKTNCASPENMVI